MTLFIASAYSFLLSSYHHGRCYANEVLLAACLANVGLIFCDYTVCHHDIHSPWPLFYDGFRDSKQIDFK